MRAAAAVGDCVRQAARQFAKSLTDPNACPRQRACSATTLHCRPQTTTSLRAHTHAPLTCTLQRLDSPLWPQHKTLRSNTTQAATPPGQEGASTGLPTLLVFGGNGFVGTRICEEALKTGLAVVSISRSGAPKQNAAWTNEVEWVQADVFDVAQWRSRLEGAIGVISCLGAFGSNDFMFKICGDSNITIFNEAAAAGVPRAVFVSVHDYNVPGFFLPGYFQGKRNAERVLAEKFPETGVALRPGFLHGTRQVGGVGVPLSAVGVPLDKVLGLLPAKSLSSWPVLGLGLTPPLSVQALAKAAVAAATDPSIPGGVMDLWKMKEIFET